MNKWMWVGLIVAILVGELHLVPPGGICKARGYDYQEGNTCVYESRVKPTGRTGNTLYVAEIEWVKRQNKENWAFIRNHERELTISSKLPQEVTFH